MLLKKCNSFAYQNMKTTFNALWQDNQPVWMQQDENSHSLSISRRKDANCGRYQSSEAK